MTLPPKINAACSAFFARCASPRQLFFAAAACFPAFMLQRNLAVLAAETACFFLLALARRGKINALSPLAVLACVTAFGALTPYGRVWFRVGSFPVTFPALAGGLRRALLLDGMVFLSQFAVSPRLTLPGRAGAVLAGVFACLDRLTSGAPPLAAKAAFARGGFAGLFRALDARLYEAYYQVPPLADEPPLPKPQTSGIRLRQTRRPAASLLLVLPPLLMYAALFLPHG
ncbi:hypothetical protein [Treponema endosymbiont of Eucomonympha sp.]|uniref:hypothetical protein n=1 Tax=Treponema endosymbiont of Eucomonympha sp. TaxID=1580831 RepID=UPI000781974E|nr:hypothetical protein [Treponema endosymbiont of Eucomonympha sp.]